MVALEICKTIVCNTIYQICYLLYLSTTFWSSHSSFLCEMNIAYGNEYIPSLSASSLSFFFLVLTTDGVDEKIAVRLAVELLESNGAKTRTKNLLSFVYFLLPHFLFQF